MTTCAPFQTDIHPILPLLKIHFLSYPRSNGRRRVFFTGLGVSFLGSVPVGTMNVAVMHVGLARGLEAAFAFALGALLIEMGFVRVSLLGMHWLQRQQRLFYALNWLTALVLAFLAFGSFRAALHPAEIRPVYLSSGLSPFFMGVSFRLLTPTLIPFWLGWNTVLFAKNILLPLESYYKRYILGIGLGTFLAYGLYASGGQFAANWLESHQSWLNWCVGSLFAGAAVFQVWKVLGKKAKN